MTLMISAYSSISMNIAGVGDTGQRRRSSPHLE